MIIVLDTGDHLDAGGGFGIGGWTPVLALIEIDGRVVQQVVGWTGGSGTEPATGMFIGPDGFVADAADATDLKGETGAGQPGANAWTPIEAIENDGERRVRKVVDWVAGSGEKPDVGMYVGPDGYVALPSQATDVRGPAGEETAESLRDKLVDLPDDERLPVEAVKGAAQVVNDPATRQTVLVGLDGEVIKGQFAETSWLTKIPTLVNNGQNTGSVGFTHQAMVELETEFDAVRIPHVNFGTTPMTVDVTQVSVGGDAGDALNNTAPAVPVLFGGNASVTVPPAVSLNGRVYSSVVWSDPVYISSVPRTDDGVLPLLYVRTFMSAGAGKEWSTWNVGTTGWGAPTATRKFVSRYRNGDSTTNRETFIDNTNRAFSVIFGVSYRARKKSAVSVAIFGDSITRSTNAEGFARGWHYKTQQAISTPENPFEYANFGVSSSQSDEFFFSANRFLADIKPMFALMPVFTPNEGGGTQITPATIQSTRANVLRFIDLCRANGVTPVLWEGCPRSNSSGGGYYPLAQDQWRTAWVEDSRKYGVPVIRTLDALSTEAAPYAFKPGFTTDFLHPNALGDTALGELFTGFFGRLVKLI